MKRYLSIMFALIIMTFSITACSNKGTSDAKQGTTQSSTAISASGKTNSDNYKVTYPLKFKDSSNREIVIDKEPERVVSIAPNITEIIYALGKSGKLVARTDFCDYPEEVKGIQSIGTMTNPNFEKIAELKPDLVIASSFLNQDVLKKLEELNMKVVVLYGEESFNGAYEVIQDMGEVLNAKQRAEEIISNMKARVESVQKKVDGKTKPSVYYVVGYGQYGDYTAGRDTFIGNMLEMAGGTNAAADVTGWKYSLEKLIEKNPDILICSNKEGIKDGLMTTEGYKDLKAVKNGNVYTIDENIVVRQGPRLADGLEAIAKILHPDLFK